MAISAEEKTEPPTPKRRAQARTRGQVARSQDLSAAALLIAGFLALNWFGPRLWLRLIAIVKTSLTADAPMELGELLPFARMVATEAFKEVVPFLLILFVSALVVLYLQVGWLFTLHPLIPSLNKINPLNGIKRLFSVRMVMMAFTNFGKLLVVGLIAYLTMADRVGPIVYSLVLDHYDGLLLGASLMFELGMRLAVALFLLGLLDFAWQKYKHEKDLRMTKDEVKDELRSMDGDPKMKQRRRQVQLQLAMQRLRQDVPAADVIVTNPTHVAIAVRYDNETMSAPKVVAKGADFLALRIRQIAKEFAIPIVERPPLARALYEAVDVGEYIPERFYRALAEILAYVYELSGKAPGHARPAVPAH